MDRKSTQCHSRVGGNDIKQSMQQSQGLMTNKLPPISPGQILLEEFMELMGISQSKLARGIEVPVTRINNIIKDYRSINDDTAHYV